jgi:hypothetical protein
MRGPHEKNNIRPSSMSDHRLLCSDSSIRTGAKGDSTRPRRIYFEEITSNLLFYI